MGKPCDKQQQQQLRLCVYTCESPRRKYGRTHGRTDVEGFMDLLLCKLKQVRYSQVAPVVAKCITELT